jgi:hypothetical protein
MDRSSATLRLSEKMISEVSIGSDGHAVRTAGAQTRDFHDHAHRHARNSWSHENSSIRQNFQTSPHLFVAALN